MGFFSRKNKNSSSENYSVTADRSMTRWESRYCNACGRPASHKIAREQPGSDRAIVNCTECKKWEEEYW